MALIECPECGKEISNQSTVCIHCGCPITPNRKAPKTPNTSFSGFMSKLTSKFSYLNKKRVLVTIVVILMLPVVVAVSANKISEAKKEKAYQNMLVESHDNMAPYLELIPYRPDETGKIHLSSEMYNNLDNIEFLGLTGSVSFSKNDYGVFDKVSWRSHDFFTYDEHQEFVPLLNDYFGHKAKLDHYLIGQWTQKDYYWEDMSGSTVVVFYTSVRANHEHEKDRIEIYWDFDAEMPS